MLWWYAPPVAYVLDLRFDPRRNSGNMEEVQETKKNLEASEVQKNFEEAQETAEVQGAWWSYGNFGKIKETLEQLKNKKKNIEDVQGISENFRNFWEVKGTFEVTLNLQ